MNKIAFLVLAGSMLLLGPAVFAQNKPVESPKEQTGSSPPAAGRRFSDFSPEEQAKLKEQRQNMSPEDRAKVRDKARDRTADTGRGTQGQGRRERMVSEMARLQEQYKSSVADLQAIKQLAVKENATETAAALTRLIAKHEMQFNQQMQLLQRRMRMLAGDQQTRTGTETQTQADKQPKPSQKAQTVEPKKDEPKPQSTETKPR